MQVDVYAHFFFRADDYRRGRPNSRAGKQDERFETACPIGTVEMVRACSEVE
jgi:hypothetical protein